MKRKGVCAAIAVVICLSLGISGCAGINSFLTGPVKALLCSPTDEQVEQAQTAADFLELVSGFVSGDFRLDILKARHIFFNVAIPAFCVTLEQLEEAINTFDQAALILEDQANENQAIKAWFEISQPVPDISSLRELVKK